jgi:hypothetical protein
MRRVHHASTRRWSLNLETGALIKTWRVSSRTPGLQAQRNGRGLVQGYLIGEHSRWNGWMRSQASRAGQIDIVNGANSIFRS